MKRKSWERGAVIASWRTVIALPGFVWLIRSIRPAAFYECALNKPEE